MLDSKNICIGSLWNPADREKAAKLLSKGEIVGVFNRGVCALWFDGNNAKTIERVAVIKGEQRRGRPIALTLSLEEFIPMIDTDKLPRELKKFLLSSDIKHKVGSLCFIRAPLKADFQKNIPKWAKNFEGELCMVQNWDSFGHDATEKFLESVKKLGVKHPGVTSMNKTGQAELVNQKEGEEFAKENGVPIFLKDEKAHPKHLGSYTIFTFNKFGIKLERNGNIPAKIFKFIFCLPIDTKNAKSIKHPQLKFPIAEMKKLPPAQIRNQILSFINQYV